MQEIDALIIAALPLEFDAARDVAAAQGVVLEPSEDRPATLYLAGNLTVSNDRQLRIALARPTRMGGTSTTVVAASLAAELRPRCLAMCGVCAGNPADVVLGDLIIAEMAYVYDEGKRKLVDDDGNRKLAGFEGDHRQIPLQDAWLHAAQDMRAPGLPSWGAPTETNSRWWLLELLHTGVDPRNHPACRRYLPEGQWATCVRSLELDGLVRRDGMSIQLTEAGRSAVMEHLFYRLDPPQRLPFAIHVGPFASGNAVVKDGLTWDALKALGVRSILGLEMEAAAIATTAFRLGIEHWTVIKGVMDYADPNKDDRFKPFAARASAEVLLAFLRKVMPPRVPAKVPAEPAAAPLPGSVSVNSVSNVQGCNISIQQTYER